jgi:hypothetical protein
MLPEATVDEIRPKKGGDSSNCYMKLLEKVASLAIRPTLNKASPE